jgi:Ca-activated chloride channel family protein
VGTRISRENLARLITAVYAVTLVIGVLWLRPGCVQLVVWASQEKSDQLGSIAERYGQTRPSQDLRCVDIKVVLKASGEAEQALAHGAFGPNEARPHVWSPAANTWVDLLEQDRIVAGLPAMIPAARPSIARSPLVIAMPDQMAKALGWPAKDISWLEIFSLAQDPQGWASRGHPEWGLFKLGKTNPLISTSGLHALIATYKMSGGASIDDTNVRAFMKSVELSVVHYGRTVSAFLTNLADADDRGEGLSYVSAIAMEEKQVWEYNDGNPEFRANGKRLAPNIPLAAVYPREGTLVADHPYGVLDAPWVGDEQRRAAARFLDHLRSDAVQQEFKAAAFRGARGETGPVIANSPWLNPFKPAIQLALPDPAKLLQIQSSWKDYRKSARVLFVVDVSGSMGDRLGSAPASKLDLAKQALSSALDQFGPDDQVGLWALAGTEIRQLLGVAPLRDQTAQLRAEIDRLKPGGTGRSLYATVANAVASMRQRIDRDRINAVIVLTDGRNDDPANSTLNGLVRTLRAQTEDERVRVFTIAYGAGADQESLDKIALASRGTGYDAVDASVIGRVILDAVSNF